MVPPGRVYLLRVDESPMKEDRPSLPPYGLRRVVKLGQGLPLYREEPFAIVACRVKQHALMLVLLGIICGSVRRVEAAKPERIVVYGRSRDASALWPMPSQTIPLEARPLRLETLGDVLSEIPGVALFRQGGVGASQFLSIRGADFDQTVVLVDDVPLVGPDRGAVDFSLLPVDGFERVEIYRGSAPIRYGGGTVGGVIRLVPKEVNDGRVSVMGSVGAFDTQQMRAEAEGILGPVSILAAGGGLWAQNNFSYLNDNATTLTDLDDDRVVERQNADVQQGNGFFTARWTDGPHRIAMLGMVVSQDRGLPGPATVVSLESRQQRTRLLGSLGYRVELEGRMPVAAFVTASLGLDEDRVQDILGRIGMGREDTQDRYISLDIRTGAFVSLLSWWTLGVTAAIRRDDIQPNNRFVVPEDKPSSRDLGVVAAESLLSAQYASWRLSLRSGLSGQYTGAYLTESAFLNTEVYEYTRWTPSFRVEGVARFRDVWTVSALLTSGIKLPTTLQLFGNRDTIVANPMLKPEESLSIEVGVALRSELAFMKFRAETRIFGLEVHDLIVAQRTSQRTIVFTNERSGQSWGWESSLSADIGSRIQSSSSLTILDSRFDYRGFGREQPLRVPLRFFQRLQLALLIDSLSTFVEIDHRSGFSADPDNQVRQKPYTSVNGGVQAASLADGIHLAFSVRNLLDVNGLDLLDFPRPGRSYEIAIQWKKISK